MAPMPRNRLTGDEGYGPAAAPPAVRHAQRPDHRAVLEHLHLHPPGAAQGEAGDRSSVRGGAEGVRADPLHTGCEHAVVPERGADITEPVR